MDIIEALEEGDPNGLPIILAKIMRKAVVLLLSLLNFSHAREIDYFFTLCNFEVLTNAAAMTACPPAAYGEEAKQYACLCSNKDYAATVYQCISEFSKLSNRNNALKSSWSYLGDRCMRYTFMPPTFTLDETIQAVEANPITTTFAEANKTLAMPFLLPDEYYSGHNMNAGLDYHFQRWASKYYGEATVGFVFGLIFLQIVFNLLSWLIPSLVRVASNNAVGRFVRQHFILPALFNGRRAQPLVVARHFYFCFPPRFHSVMIAGYFILSTVFLCYHYPAYLTPAISATKPSYIAENVAYRAGVIGMYNVPLLWLFAGRNNFLIWATGWQFEVFNHWHRWIARLFTIEILIHAAGWTNYTKVLGYFASSFQDAYWNWGIVALFFMCFLCFNGTKSLRAPAYDVFLALHVLGAVFVIVGMWYHLTYVEMCLQQLYTAIAVWGFDRLARLARILAANPLISRAVLTAHEDEVFELTVHYSKLWKPKAGTYVFIHFMDPLKFWQSHPFTVMKPAKEDEDGTLKLYAKARGGITRSLYNKANTLGQPLCKRVWLEGPYGVEFNIKPFKETVLVAGGIGITAVYSHLMGLADTHKDHTFYVHWTIKDTQPIAWFHHELQKIKSLDNVQMTLYITSQGIGTIMDRGNGKDDSSKSDEDESKDKKDQIIGSAARRDSSSSLNVFYTRPSANAIVLEHIRNSRGPICVFVCGPAGMSDDVRHACANGLSQTKNYVQFYEESFTM